MPNVETPLEPWAIAVLLGTVAWMGGLYLINTARLLNQAALAPLQDPRMDEALTFENT